METTQAKDVGIKGRSSLKVAALIANFGAKFLLFVRPFLQQLHESVQPPMVNLQRGISLLDNLGQHSVV
jgi:hypothetical protein